MHSSEPVDSPAPRWRERARLAEQFDALGVRFVSGRIQDSWRAIAYVSGHGINCALDEGWGHFLDDWQEQLSLLLEQIKCSRRQHLYKFSESGLVSVCEISGVGGQKQQLICKQGRSGTMVQALGSRWRGPKMWREYWMGHRLLKWGLPTPVPLACMWRHDGNIRLESWMVTPFVEEALPLDRAFRKRVARQAETHPRARELEALLDSVCGMLAALGSRSLYHRDLKPGNILVSTDRQESRPWLIDLDGVGRDASPFGSGFHRSIVRLVVGLREQTDLSRTAYLRGLHGLLRHARAPEGSIEEWWRELTRAADQAHRKRGPQQV